MPRAVSGIEFGKVKVYSEASLDDVLKTFKTVMKDFGYPEENGEPDLDFDINEGDEPEEDEAEAETEVPTEDEESPWLRAAKKNGSA